MKYYLISLLILVLISCENTNTPKDDPTHKITIEIGVLIPLSGTGASIGESSKAALDFLYSNSSLLKILVQNDEEIELKLTYFDTQTNPDKALEGMLALYEQGIRTFIGPFASSELEKIVPIAETMDILVVSPASVASTLSFPKNNVFRFVPDDKVQAKAVHKYFENENMNYAVGIYRDDVWGSDLASAVMDNYTYSSFSNDGFAYNVNQSDLQEKTLLFGDRLAELIAETTSKTVGYLATYSEGTSILQTLANHSQLNNIENLQLFGSSAFANNSDLLDNSVSADFAIKTNLLCPTFGLDPGTQAVWGPIVSTVKAKIGRDPEIYAIVACDALQILARTHLLAENTEGFENLRAIFIEQTNSYGITGNLELNENNDRRSGNQDFWTVEKIGDKYQWKVYATYIAADNTIIKK